MYLDGVFRCLARGNTWLQCRYMGARYGPLLLAHNLIRTTSTVQTFLAYPDFLHSAACLDQKRLGKQRVEVLQILQTLVSGRRAWSYHPAVKMWRGHEKALAFYGIVVCAVWRDRGYAVRDKPYNDTCSSKLEELCSNLPLTVPPWLGDERLHSSHRSNLLRKDLDWYRQFKWAEPNNLPYFWPVT